jgi:hypothetical protein
MTTTTSLDSTPTTDHERARRLVVPVGLVSFLVATALSFEGRDGMGEWYVEVGLQIVVGLLVFGVVVPRGLRHESAGGRAIVMGALGLLLVVPAFWSGLPMLLGAGAALLGYAGRRAGTGSGKSIAAFVIGMLSVIAYLAIYVADYAHVHGG